MSGELPRGELPPPGAAALRGDQAAGPDRCLGRSGGGEDPDGPARPGGALPGLCGRLRGGSRPPPVPVARGSVSGRGCIVAFGGFSAVNSSGRTRGLVCSVPAPVPKGYEALRCEIGNVEENTFIIILNISHLCLLLRLDN